MFSFWFVLIFFFFSSPLVASKANSPKSPTKEFIQKKRAEKSKAKKTMFTLKFALTEWNAKDMREFPLGGISIEMPELAVLKDQDEIIERITVCSNGEYLKEVKVKSTGKIYTYSNAKDLETMRAELDLQEKALRGRKPGVYFHQIFGTFYADQNQIGKYRPSL